jgi:transcriptional coactivator p15 (PC4)
MSDAPDTVIAVIPKNNRGETIRVALREFKGAQLADIRVMVDGEDGKAIFTQKGVAVPIRRLPAVIEALQAALDTARRQGLFAKDQAEAA